MLIASHSGQFQEDGTNNGTLWWIGDDKCGWDGCTLNLNTTISRDKIDPVASNYNFVGIPCPMDLGEYDKITICGIAYCPNGEKFGAALTYFNCSSFSAPYYDNNLLVYDPNFYYQDDQICFELSYTLGFEETLTACDAFFVVGLNTQVSTSEKVIFSYSLHIDRNCNPQ